MRRTLLIAALSMLAAPDPVPSAQRHRSLERVEDNRLLGTWRSDKERTLASWQFKEGIDPKAKETISSWFGKLTHTYTRRTIVTVFEASRFKSNYHVVSKTESSCTLVSSTEGREETETVYFQDQYMFKRVGSSLNFEYFSKIAA